MLTKERENEIIDKIGEIAPEYKNGIGMSMNYLGKICSKLKVGVYLSKSLDESISGKIVRKEGITLIYLNYDNTVYRNKFTIAHEIGHYVLHMLGEDMENEFIDTVLYKKDGVHEEKEEEANFFAAELLMPKDIIKKEFEKLNFEYEFISSIISRMANDFEVSKEAMRYRLNNLHLTV